MTELFHFNDDSDEDFVNTFKKSRVQLENEHPVNSSLSKMYLLAYKYHAQQQGFKLKRLTFNFVAPYITPSAYQTAQFFNKGVKTLGGIECYIHLWSLESFINELLSLIPNDKWYIKNNFRPATCLAKHKVSLLVENNLAIIK